jgi:hypothetical protein
MKELENKTSIKIKDRILKFIPLPAMIGIVVGAIGGYIYYVEIGCATGTCPLTSNPYGSIVYGALIGYLFGDMFTKKKKVEPKVEEE